MKIKKGDKVKIISGKDKGKEGIVEKIYKKSNKVLIPGINLYKRHLKTNPERKQGGIVDVPRPLDVSKIMLICPKCKKTTRIGFKIDNKKKIRFCKKCQNKI
ncbi:MAG: 50S ribosomal protein L24 [Patescibacteria group bacterium]|nr:50S ribosomal protein L24 [Patescibacteria group bacterium]